MHPEVFLQVGLDGELAAAEGTHERSRALMENLYIFLIRKFEYRLLYFKLAGVSQTDLMLNMFALTIDLSSDHSREH